MAGLVSDNACTALRIHVARACADNDRVVRIVPAGLSRRVEVLMPLDGRQNRASATAMRGHDFAPASALVWRGVEVLMWTRCRELSDNRNR